MKKFLFIIFILLIASESKSQVMLKDVLPNANTCISCGSYPRNFKRVDNYVYFIADDGDHGSELWKTDGTEIGTVMVKDINPNPGGDCCGSIYGWYGPYATPIFDVDDKVVFFANDGIHGYEPWVSDGTESGTQLILDLNGSSTSSFGVSINTYFEWDLPVQIGNKILFNAQDINQVHNTWVTDGTASGTHILTDQNGNNLLEWNGAVVSDSFAYLDINGIYKTDGTSVGTQLYTSASTPGEGMEMTKIGDLFYFTSGELKVINAQSDTLIEIDINPGLGTSQPHRLIAYNGKLYFWADDVVHGSEFWVSDGTAIGTHLIKDINPGLPHCDGNLNAFPIVYNGLIYFIADSASQTFLWKSDGTAAGTVPVTDPTIVMPYNYFWITKMRNLLGVVGNELYFPGLTLAEGVELWKTDGTISGATMMNETCIGNCGGVQYGPTMYGGYCRNFYYDGDNIYFSANDGEHGEEPWILGVNIGIPSVNENQKESVLYPNPAIDFFTLKFPRQNDVTRLQMFDLLGRKVKEINHFNQEEIKVNRENLPGGIYSVMVIDANEKIIFSQKVIFQ